MSKGSWHYKFTLAQLAIALGLTDKEVKLAKRRGDFNPSSIRSVLEWAIKHCLVLPPRKTP